MNLTQIETAIIDYLNNELDDKERARLESLINSDSEVQNLFLSYQSTINTFNQIPVVKTPESVHNNFHNFLQLEIENKEPQKIIKPNFKFIKQAAIGLVLLCSGLVIGNYLKLQDNAGIYTQNTNNDFEELLRHSSTSARIKAVNMSSYMDSSDKDITDALIKTFLNDNSDHVRLACIESLSKFASNVKVRQAFIKALETEDDPTIQISLINVLTSIQEKNAVKSFDKIIQNDNAVNFVRDEAQSGKLRLIDTF